jgi:hypothetical protein
VIGPRREQACGCVGDTLYDGQELWIPCPEHSLKPGPDVYDVHGQLMQRFVVWQEHLLPVNRVRLRGEP